MGIYEQILPWAERDPERIALISELEGLRTYGEVIDGADRFAYALSHSLGVAEGERVACWLPNRFEWFDTYIGATRVGCSVVQLSPDWGNREMGFVLGHSRARVIVCEASHAARAVELRREYPSLEHVITVDEAAPGAHLLRDLLAGAPADCRAFLRIPSLDAPAALTYTSGTTTGRPKAVPFRIAAVNSIIDYAEMFGLTPADRCLFVTPLYHGNAGGAWQSALGYGASAVFQRKFSASSFWRLVDTYRPTYLFTLVPIVNILIGRPPRDIERAHSFRVMIALGSGPTAHVIEERFGVPVIDWYGMTEAGAGTYTRLGDERRPGSSGRPFANSTMTILRDDLTAAPPGEIGEVAFALDGHHFAGYLDDEEATAAAVHDGYFFTGDLGYFDDDRYFYFVDRKKDIVRRGGYNVSSLEVEAALRLHPGIGDVAIVAQPDPVLGELIVAFVVPNGEPTPDLAHLREFGATQLASYKLPDALRIVDDFPRTGSGKVEKFRLRASL